MNTVYSCHRHRGLVFLRDIVRLDDWNGDLTAIREAEKSFKDDTHTYAALQTNSYLGQLVAHQLSEPDRECLQHLRLTDPRLDKQRIELTKGGLVEGSYRWVIHSPEFRQWCNDAESQLLWIKGDPGKGKTMLLCGIIDELREANVAGVSFFFCQASDARINNATAVICGLLYLLVEQQPSLLAHVRKKYDRAGEQLFKSANAWIEVTNIMTNVLQDPALEKSYLIVDALDECVDDDDRLNLLKFIVQSSASSRVKWIASSRNWQQIEEQLNLAPQRIRLSLEMNAESVATAVDHYIRYKTEHLSKLKKYDLKTETAIRDYLSLHADGTFLWVALICKYLEEKVSRMERRGQGRNVPSWAQASVPPDDGAPTKLG